MESCWRDFRYARRTLATNRGFTAAPCCSLARPVPAPAQIWQHEALQGALMSANFSPIIGVAPATGRGLLPQDDEPSSAALVVTLSHAPWRQSAWRESGGGGAPAHAERTRVHHHRRPRRQVEED
jgi:hypothetical protein